MSYNITSTGKQHEHLLSAFANLRRHLAYSGAPLPNGKIDKAPLSPSTGFLASMKKPATWGTREAAERRAKRLTAPGHRPGIGIALGDLGDGTYLCGVDLDGCLAPDGTMEPWAVSILDRLDSYAETSPSDTGVKVFFKVAAADIPALREAMGKNDQGDWKDRNDFMIGPHKGMQVHREDSYYTVTERTYGPVKPLRRVPLADLLWLVQVAGPALVPPPEAAPVGKRAKGGPKDNSGSGVAYRHLQDTFWAGGTVDDARAAIEADQGAAGDWWRRTTEREQDRAVRRARASVKDVAPPSTDLFDSCWTPEQLAEVEWLADYEDVIGPLPKGKAVALTESETGGGRDLIRRGGRIVANQSNTTTLLGRNLESVLPGLHRNEMTGRDEWAGGEVNDDDIHNVRAAIEHLGIVQIGKELIDAAVSAIALRRKRHPIRDWLAPLHHDGVPRLDSWLVRYAGAEDTPYTRAVGSAFLISMVARVMQPGCKADHVLVLVGPQGAGKSRLCELLAGSEYYSGSLTSLAGTDKDSREHLCGIWLAEIVEMAPARRSENDEMKAFLTTNADRLRLAYGRRTVTLKRQCVFVGTTNDDEFLRDPTGGRRFWPITVGAKIDLEGLAQDREQLFAEAMAAYQAGEQWHLDPAFEAEHARPVQEAARVQDTWAEDIAAWLDKPETDFDESEMRRDSVTLSEVMFGALGLTSAQKSRVNEKRAADVMRGLGWIKRHTRKGKVWGRPGS